MTVFSQSSRLTTRVARFHNVYGPHGTWDGGREKAPAAICRKVIHAVETGTDEIEIWGDGKQTRDYVFVGDVVRANVAALATSHVGGINIGTGRETDVSTICRLLRQNTGSKVEAIHGPAKRGEQTRSCLQIGRAEKVLGWQPEVAIEQGLQKTVSYYRKNDLS